MSDGRPEAKDAASAGDRGEPPQRKIIRATAGTMVDGRAGVDERALGAQGGAYVAGPS
jgi:hypothetical protein